MSLIPKLVSQCRIAREFIGRANERRDQGRFLEAAALYVEALRFLPHRADLNVQAGHMFKEGGDLANAELHYREAERMMPEDADLSLQLGHFFKVAGRREEAVVAYQRALTLRPTWTEVRQELNRLGALADAAVAQLEPLATDTEAEAAALSASLGFMVQRDLLPRPAAELFHAHSEGIELRRLGRAERTSWGTKRVIRGVEAIRGFCISPTPLLEVLILVNGVARHRGALDGGYEIKREKLRPELQKYIFNAWIDFSSDLPGLYDVDIRITDARNRRYTRHEQIVIQPALTEAEYPQLDGVVELGAADDRSVEEQINQRPSQIRSARRALLPEAPRTILVQRIDQLGDMVVSVPALRRLRSLFPDARIVGLVSKANQDLASDLGFFDEVLVTEFPEDWDQRRRIMPLERQRELVDMFKPYKFDMAIDMSENGWARRVLMLSGAPFLYGFRAGDDVPGLSLDLEGNTHDRWNGYEVVPHTNKMLGMMEWLGAMARSEPNVVRRTRASDEPLAALGLRPSRRYAVVHDGARLLFSRWPYFNTLAEMILRETDLDVVMLRDDQSKGAGLSPVLEASDRFLLMPPRLSYDGFDALLANTAVFVGNDSGPKHLASLRGAEVVSIHMARTNWNEWGQESSGYIVSRKVPCAGCMIHYDAEECGAGFVCLRNITPEEVMVAIKAVLDAPGRAVPTATLERKH